MALNQTRIPGQRSLENRVVHACGPGSRFAELGFRFGEWVQNGSDAPPAIVGEVEERVAGYLGLAAETGRRWGVRIGGVIGIVVGTVMVLIGLAIR